MTLEENMKELYRIIEEQKKIESELKFHKAYICQQHHPLKIGDEVICNGWSHRGKTLIVDKVFLYSLWGGKYQFRASGLIKKKNRAVGSQRGEWEDNQ